MGINTQGVRATATAQVAAGNAVRCIKPLVVADRWADNSGTGSNTTGWDQEDFFNVGIDTYNTAANGYSAAQDVGREMMLKGDGNNFSAGWSLEIDLNGGNGGSVYSDELAAVPVTCTHSGPVRPAHRVRRRARHRSRKGVHQRQDGREAGAHDAGR